MLLARFLTIVLCQLTVIHEVTCESVVVTTQYGALRGTRVSLENGLYVDRFLQIPYASPPTGDLRFRAPVPPTVWRGIRNATEIGPQCAQQPRAPEFSSFPVFLDSEDCLHLNVYTPRVTSGVGPLPVMVWIHGGGFTTGAAILYDATLLASRGVVVVSINYRLHALGFLCTEDASSPGNYGLQDQVLALKWVRDSIAAFNGNPDDVTIFGESAGGISVSLLILSRAAAGLFTKAVMESGSSLGPLTIGHPRLNPKPRTQAMELASRVGCDTSEQSVQIVRCLRSVDVQAIVNATIDMQIASGGQFLFRPVVETTFLQDGMFAALPETILENGAFINVTTIRGFNDDEGATALDFVDPENDGITLLEFQQLLNSEMIRSTFLQSWMDRDLTRVSQLLLDAYVYSYNLTDPIQLRTAFFKMLTDFSIKAPVQHELQLMTRFPVPDQYVYRFSYRSANRLDAPWMGAVHADELYYVFGSPFSNLPNITGFVSEWTDDDRQVSEDMMTLWTNFAKYGNPTPDGYEGERWRPWTPDTPALLDISLSSGFRNEDLNTTEVALWINTIFKPEITDTGVVIG